MGRNLGSACVSPSLENRAESSTGDCDALTLHPAFSHVVGIILDQDQLTQRSCSILFWTKDLIRSIRSGLLASTPPFTRGHSKFASRLDGLQALFQFLRINLHSEPPLPHASCSPPRIAALAEVVPLFGHVGVAAAMPCVAYVSFYTKEGTG